MDPVLWDAIQSLRSRRKQQSVDNNSNAPESNQNSHCEYSGYTVVQPQSSASGSEEWEGPSSTSYDLYNPESEAKDPDGEQLLIEDEDPELARKREELREIEDQIKQKKVSIALKTVEHITHTVKNATEAPSTNGESGEREGPTLRERAHAILQQRHPDSFLSEVHTPPKGILKSSSHSKLQGDHPLKLRVKTVMRQRRDDPFVLSTYGQVPGITQPPPAQRETSAGKQANSIGLGFQRFLSVLNKGVDMEMLSRIVNTVGEDLPVKAPNIQPPALVDKLELPLRSERQEEDHPLRSDSQGSSRGAFLPHHSRTSSRERKSNLHSGERSLSERFSLPSDEQKRNDGGDRCLFSGGVSLPSHSPTSSAERKISQERALGHKLSLPEDEVKSNQAERCFASSSRSRSPPALKKKKEKTPKVDDHREQLQNVLQTLGLSLEVEEMSKLTDRTQERLYGKKRAESREKQESQQRGPHTHYRNFSSSSSSSSSSSGSASRSSSRSPSRSQLCRNEDCKERHKKDGEPAKDTFTHENPNSHQPIPTYSAHRPAGFPADYSFPQYSQYEQYQNTFNGVTNSHPAPFYPSDYSHLRDPFHHFSDPPAALKEAYKHHRSAQDVNFRLNPDLSRSEGQVGSASGSRCLRVVSTQQTTLQRCVKTLAGQGKKRRKKIYWLKKQAEKRAKFEKDLEVAKVATERLERRERKERKEVTREKEEALHVNEGGSETEQSEEEKQAPTEEEIKKNLRKMLAAFNQKSKPDVKATQLHGL